MLRMINRELEIHQHIFWEKKDHFLLDEDIDSHWVLYAIEDGECYYEISDFHGYGTFGDIIICPPNILLKRKMIMPLSFHVIKFSLPENLQHFPVGKISINDVKRLNNTYHYLRLFSFNQNKFILQWKASLIADILNLHNIETNFHNDLKNVTDDTLIYQALAYLNKHAYNKVKIKEVSSQLGLSSVQFTRRFEASVGITPIEYVTSLRLKRAQVLLLKTNLTLDDIAAKCGYDNGFYLSRVFSKKIKMTPSEYRNR